MTHDPYPLLYRIGRVVPSRDMIPMDLDDPQVWVRPPITDFRFLVVHWGGGPNPAGEPVEEPGLTFAEKVAVELGRCKTVLTAWMHYHMQSRGMSTIAYSTAVPAHYGPIIRLRGHRFNGGQWGSINQITHAVVLIMGFGQTASRRAWQNVGLIWFAGGAPQVVGHRFFNDWPQTQTTTTCPGDENSRIIADKGYVTALGRLRWRPGGAYSRGRRVRAITCKLIDLGLLEGGTRNRYTREVRDAVAAFQQRPHWTWPDPIGQVGPATWRALAEA
jgi:hypothetical protein